MTINQFISKAEAYYGRYNTEQMLTVRLWLSGKSEKATELIYSEVLKSLSPVYKTPPCVKELEDAWKIIKRDRWTELQPKALPEPIELTEEEQQKNRELVAGLLKRIGRGRR